MQGINLGQGRDISSGTPALGAIIAGALGLWWMLPTTLGSSWYLCCHQWCFSLPNVFQTTSYTKTTSGIIMEIDTVLELEGILKVIWSSVFNLQIVAEAQKRVLLLRPESSQSLYGPAKDKANVHWHLVRGCFYWAMASIHQRKKKFRFWYMTLQELLKFASVSNLHPFVPPCHSLYFLSQSTFYYRHFQLPTVLIMPWTSSCSYLQLMLNFFCLVLILNDIFPPPQSLSCFPLHAGYFTQHSRYTSQGIYSVATVGTIFKYC